MPNPSSGTLVLARCDRAFAPDGGAPAWVHLFPEGKMIGRDGRIFDLADPGALVLAFQSSGVDLPIDCEHQNDLPEAKLHGPVGLALGSRTPPEIAIAILAELIAARNGVMLERSLDHKKSVARG